MKFLDFSADVRERIRIDLGEHAAQLLTGRG
jgi:hypothetical protein